MISRIMQWVRLNSASSVANTRLVVLRPTRDAWAGVEVGLGESHLDVTDDVEKAGTRESWSELLQPVRCRLNELVERVAYAEVGGNEHRDCIQPRSQGMARRSAMDFFPLRLAGREPRRACSSSATGVACSK